MGTLLWIDAPGCQEGRDRARPIEGRPPWSLRSATDRRIVPSSRSPNLERLPGPSFTGLVAGSPNGIDAPAGVRRDRRGGVLKSGMTIQGPTRDGPATGRVSSTPIEPKSLSTSRLQRVVYDLPDEVVPSPSPIRSSRSAKSNNSCWISAIRLCRASCLIFSAIARLSSPLPSRSLLIGVSSTESDSRRRRGASVSLSIGTPEKADKSSQIWLIWRYSTDGSGHRHAAQCRGNLTT
jgi:hypothetical protein